MERPKMKVLRDEWDRGSMILHMGEYQIDRWILMLTYLVQLQGKAQ